MRITRPHCMIQVYRSIIPSNAETRLLLREKNVKIMVADVLAPCIANTSAAMIFTMLGTHLPVVRAEGFKKSTPIQCREFWNMQIHISWNKFRKTKVDKVEDEPASSKMATRRDDRSVTHLELVLSWYTPSAWDGLSNRLHTISSWQLALSTYTRYEELKGSVQKRCNSSADTLELPLLCTDLSLYHHSIQGCFTPSRTFTYPKEDVKLDTLRQIFDLGVLNVVKTHGHEYTFHVTASSVGEIVQQRGPVSAHLTKLILR